MDHGERLDVAERLIISPGVGVYHPLEGDLPAEVAAGEVIGHVTVAGDERLPVRSPFPGQLVEVVAWAGERVAHRQRIAWVRTAA